ncbi:winged helix-turn-helix domain-containing protein [Niabella yanshanensis]|uniref:Winged helix-turn-helix domain-containing protein n=1 Tax=Niabella yanshanensis TaxID=577386 RepID=A0ABZ0W5H1_9BACT|nr:winged helix-turn-helix domain-containing protein [Niabella yanshanensis]WQD36767.1 winged helix-turn-helix domain-containing protein [Niabella yanshanensis]
MLYSRNLLPRKRKYLFGSIFVSLIAVICLAFTMAGSNNFDIARREVLLRRVGHEILLQSGDSVSRVLPVQKIGANKYRISFENAFTFQPESLVNTTRQLLAKDPLAGDYIVTILNAGNASVAYGFAISSDKKDEVIACAGRKQPTARYMMDIQYKPTNIDTVKKVSILGGLPVLAFVGFIFLRSVKRRKVLPGSKDADTISLGSVLFDAKNRSLIINESTIDLTGTETRLMSIFALSPNEIIERSRLQKEIWEDEGVIVGRSLDMFISKLRKKLESDARIKIAVIRGKGYKLEINS